MFRFLIGLPGRFTERCEGLAAALAERAFGPMALVRADKLEEIALNALRTGVSRGLVTSRQAGQRLRLALAETGQTFIVAVDRPRRAVADLATREHISAADAVRRVASSCGALVVYIAAPGALVLSSGPDGLDAEKAAVGIARHFSLPLNDTDIADVCREFLGSEAAPLETGTETWWDGLGAAEAQAAEGALAPYLDFPAIGTGTAINWAPELFLRDERSSEPATGLIDVTGLARCLLHGPYIMLPPGTWSAVLSLRFSHEAAEYDFLVEVLTDRQLASTTIRPHADGHFDAELTFVIDDSSDHPVSIRLSTQRAAFDGLVMLHGARLVPHPA